MYYGLGEIGLKRTRECAYKRHERESPDRCRPASRLTYINVDAQIPMHIIVRRPANRRIISLIRFSSAAATGIIIIIIKNVTSARPCTRCRYRNNNNNNDNIIIIIYYSNALVKNATADVYIII